MREFPKIVAAAVEFEGKIYQGKRHAFIMREIWDQLGPVYIRQENQGFLTDKGKFVNRFQAGAIAFKAGQTKTRKHDLLSEDLW